MKLTNFRVRDLIYQKQKPANLPNYTEGDTQEQNHSKNDESRLCSVLQSFEKLISSYLPPTHQKFPQAQNFSFHPDPTRDFEPRDRFVTLNLPDLPDIQNGNDCKAKQNRKKEIEAWTGEVCKASISIGFNYFMDKKVDESQMKAFVCENFLRNLVLFVEKCKINAEQLEIIDNLLKSKVLPYLKAKYPLTGHNEVNKALKKAVKSIDNSQMVQNDYLFSSKIYFQYRKDGQYDDMIMKLINEIMQRCNLEIQLSDNEIVTNYKDFENLMEETFKKSFDEQWMDSSIGKVKDERKMEMSRPEPDGKSKLTVISEQVKKSVNNQKAQTKTKTKAEEEYQQKVKDYTSFLIGRKISQNTEPFTEDQINSKSISINSPAILRILTKWCEELWQKFENENYFLERNDGFSAGPNKIIEFLSKKKKIGLMDLIKEEKEEIESFVKQVFDKNYKQQIDILQSEFKNEEDGFIERKERVSAKFAWKSVNSIESFLVSYLNRLIHGLTTVSLQLQKNFIGSPPLNLVTFNISDLFRCKYASKQKQVLKVFEELQRMSDEMSHKFKIIRIKNRLQQGTHDILINAKFNNLINCEIQIAVHTSQSEFMRCSNKINHFIYELERAQFGPLMEMCSVWRYCDKKADMFGKFIEKEKPRKSNKLAQNLETLNKNQQKELVPQEDPFICSECSRHYHNNNFFQENLKNQDSSYRKCAPCLIKEHFNAEDRDFFFKKDDKLLNKYKFIKQVDEIPENGAFIFINKPKKEVVLFKKTYQNFNMKEYLSGLKNQNPATLIEITSKKQRRAFLKQALLFQLDEEIVNEHLKYQEEVFEDRIDRQELIPGYLKNCFQQESEVITINESQNLTVECLKQIFGENKRRLKCLLNINLGKVSLDSLDFLSSGLQNVKSLNLSWNKIRDISKACLLVNLEKLQMAHNEIESIPADIQNLQKLKLLELSQNKISSLPDQLGNLKSLIEINLQDNQLHTITSKIGQLLSLQTLNLYNNQIQTIPSEIGQLSSLQTLYLHNNKLQAIPCEIGHLSSLQALWLNANQLQTIPLEIGQLSSLRILSLYNNQLTQVPSQIGQLSKLQTLWLYGNKIQRIPSEIGNLTSLQLLSFSSNQLQAIPQEIGQLSSLQYLSFYQNKLKTIPLEISKLSSLKELDLRKNPIDRIPEEVRNLKNLKIQK